ncbi:hypothetical protein PTI98_001399 [Pleurotus ostreatus]|nr:hypothetical protein PTI98_001399 [Pleurotus ostreatus]
MVRMVPNSSIIVDTLIEIGMCIGSGKKFTAINLRLPQDTGQIGPDVVRYPLMIYLRLTDVRLTYSHIAHSTMRLASNYRQSGGLCGNAIVSCQTPIHWGVHMYDD